MAFDKRKALQNALSYTQQGKWDKAIAEYQSIVKADPRDLTVCNNLGDLFARVGRTAEAIEQYLKLGELYRADGLSVKAIAVYKKIAKLDTSRTEAYLACADLYQEQGLVGEAKIQLATVAEHYSRAGDTPKLIGVYQRLTQLDPSNYVLVAKVADLLAREGIREEAAAEYGHAAEAARAVGQIAESKRLLEKARETLPDSAETNLSLGELHLKGGLYAEAVDALTKATAVEPGNPQAWRLLGQAHAALDQFEDAIAALQQAVSLGLPEPSVARPLSTLLLKAGRTDEAIAFCQKAAAAAGDTGAAVALYKDLLSAFPHLAPLHGLLADILHSLGREEEARSAMWGEATSHEASGETGPAIEVYRRLLESDPSDPEARERLEVLEAALQPPMPSGELVLPPDLGPAPSLAAATPEFPLELAEEADSGVPLEIPVEATSEEESGPLLEFPRETAPRSGGASDLHFNLESESPLGGGGVRSSTLAGATAEPSVDSGATFEMPPLTAETAGLSLEPSEPPEAPAEIGLELAPVGDDASIDFLGEGDTGLGGMVSDAEDTDKVAEQLAEAEVYLKYGLAEKARERLQEVVRLTPDNLAAHRKLKAIYLDREQVAEGCAEILTIAQLLRTRQQGEAALRELQEGLELAPDQPELVTALRAMQRGEALATAKTLAAPAQPAGFIQSPAPDSGDPDVPAALALADVDGAVTREAAEPAIPSTEEATELQVEPLSLESVEATAASQTGAGPGDAPVSLDEAELPPELRALLEGADEEPALMVDGSTSDLDQAMGDDLAEAEFYLTQGMSEEARAVLRRMEERDAEHPAPVELRAKLEEGSAAAASGAVDQEELPAEQEFPVEPPRPEEAPPAVEVPETPWRTAETAGPAGAVEWLPQEPGTPPAQESGSSRGEVVPQFTVRDEAKAAGSEGFINLGAELAQELGLAAEGGGPAGSPLMDGLLEEFQKGVREHLDERDYETHYNLGIAYKEMELYEEAVQEFRLAAHDPARAIACADLLGLCFLAIGQPDQAIAEFCTGLDLSGNPRETYHTLRYDLGMAYETKGNLARALEQYELLLKEDARFRDVRMRVQTLQDRLQRRQVPPVTPSPTGAAPAPRRSSDKRISFI
jgi:pilus assembly protein FimV